MGGLIIMRFDDNVINLTRYNADIYRHAQKKDRQEQRKREERARRRRRDYIINTVLILAMGFACFCAGMCFGAW